jgi:hypothetical protein
VALKKTRSVASSDGMSAVTQNRPVKVEIKVFKTSHFLEQKTALMAS